MPEPLRPVAALAALCALAGLASPARAHVRCDEDSWGCGSPDDGRDYDYHDYYARPPPLSAVTITRAEVDARLASAGLEACLEALAGRHRATVRVYVAADGSTRAQARVAPHDEGAETCMRRTAEAALEWGADIVFVHRAFSTRIALRSAGAAADGGTPADGTEAVQAVVTSAHPALAACLDAAGDGSLGTLTLTVRATRAGTLVLRDARVGRLVPDDDAAACLRDVVRTLSAETGGERVDATVELPL